MASQAEAPGGSAPTGTGDTGPAQPPSGAGALPWLQGLACGAMAMAQPALAAVLAGLLAPAILALVLDRQHGKPVARCLVMAGLAASVPALRTFWDAGLTAEAARSLLSDPMALGTAWSAGAAGWLTTELLPLAIRAVLEASARMRIATMQAEDERLAKQWADEDPSPDKPA